MTRRPFNRLQRVGLIAMGAGLAGLLALHNPTAGYTTSLTYYDPWPLPAALAPAGETTDSACEPPTAAQRDALVSQQKFLGRELGHCRTVPIDFLEWRSHDALLGYVSTVRKVLVIGGAILFAGLGWAWVLGDPKLQRRPTDLPEDNAAPF